VALRNGVSSSLLFRWRQQMEQGERAVGSGFQLRGKQYSDESEAAQAQDQRFARLPLLDPRKVAPAECRLGIFY